LQHEIDTRRDNAQRLRFKQAGFPASAAIEHFDFSFNPQIDEAQIVSVSSWPHVRRAQCGR
jgi:DNA replication protein DnaC